MKILLYGSRGYLGQQFLRVYPEAHCGTADIADVRAVGEELDSVKPDVVLNCAGKTGRPNVDWCEDHKAETIRGNVTGPLVLLDECGKRGIYWVHISSGCIYEGDNGGRGFAEDDPPNFAGSFYSRTKAWADSMLKEFPVLMLRLRMPFDGSREPRNLLMKLMKYKKVLDEPNSLTYMPDFIKAAEALIAKRKTGIYNVVNPGVISPWKAMAIYRDRVDPDHAFERISASMLGTITKAGRSNCVLSTAKLDAEGIRMLPVDEAVDRAVLAMGKVD
jgi:3,5-epimerase/4-reductase